MSCPINTDLAQTPAFVALQTRDQLICLVQLLTAYGGSALTPAWEYSGCSERDQWLCIGILMDEAATLGDTNPNTLLANAKDVQGADSKAALAAIDQRICNLV